MDRLIFYRGGSCNEVRVLENLKKLISDVKVVEHKCSNYDADAILAEKLFMLIHSAGAEAVFSLDYYPIIAEVCHTCGLPYISWIIDAPHYTLYSTTSFYPECRIFCFDAEEAARLTAMGRPGIFHMPLAADPAYFSEHREGAAEADISFVGSLYKNEHDYLDRQSGLTEYELGFVNGLMEAQSLLYGVSLAETVLTEELTGRLLKACGISVPATYDLPERLLAANVLEKRLTVREREKYIKILGKSFGVTLYSDAELSAGGVEFMGYADYETLMPSVFYKSRINLNLTLRSIHSGIPLRALDIMGCGGFLLSSWQPELGEYFEEGKELALFSSEEELLDKAGWYLSHEEERQAVAAAGHGKVCREFTYEVMLGRMLKI